MFNEKQLIELVKVYHVLFETLPEEEQHSHHFSIKKVKYFKTSLATIG